MLLLLYRNSQTWPEQLSPISESSQCQKLERWLWSQQPKEIILPFCYKAEAGLCSETPFEGGRVLPWSYSSDVLVAHTCNNQLLCAAGFRHTLSEELGAFLWMPIAHLVFHPACNLQVFGYVRGCLTRPAEVFPHHISAPNLWQKQCKAKAARLLRCKLFGSSHKGKLHKVLGYNRGEGKSLTKK